MSRKLIWIVTIIMGSSMVALIMFQAYWIKNAIQINERQFDQLVSRSMIDIANEIEWREAEQLIHRQLNPLMADSSVFGESYAESGDDPYFSESNEYSIPVPDPPGADNNAGSDTGSSLESSAPHFSQDRNNQDYILQNRASEPNELLANRRKFVDRVVASMFQMPPDIEDRISQVELEEIINKVFMENGLDNMSYEYAVLQWNNDIALRSEFYSIAEEKEYYRVKLFPNDLEPESNYLSIYFQQRNNSRFESIGFMAFPSLIFSLIILLSFTLTVYVIIRQKRLSEIRNDFVSNMTHELKTPISTISLASQMLGDKSIPAEMKKPDQISKIIRDECRRLGTQVEKVLQTAIFDKGKLKLRLQEVNMHEIIENAIENFNIQIKSRNGEITGSLNAENPDIIADQVHIANVLSNLIDNAIKYCTRDPVIHIKTYNKGSALIISIQDNGVGISKNDQKRVFEKFYRVPTGNIHSVKGFGLGLSYVKMIVEEHQGYIELESELYEGSKFTITLPNKAKE